MPPLCPRLWRALTLAASLVLSAPMALAGEPDPLGSHRALAVRHPEQFGFLDADEARAATLGWSYPYFSVAEWNALPRRSGAVDLEEHPAPRRLTEVRAPDGSPRCAFIQPRDPEGGYGEGVLGFPNLRPGLEALAADPRRDDIVLLVDSATRALRIALPSDPDEILEVKIP